MSVNKVILIGNLGNDPESRMMQSGDKVVNLSIATSESWKDKATGERKTNTQWHKVTIFNQNIAKVAESYLKKGSKVYIEGQLETRSWDQDGQKKYATEVILRPYKGELTMLDGRSEGGNAQADMSAHAAVDELEDEIPFAFILPLTLSLLALVSAGGIV